MFRTVSIRNMYSSDLSENQQSIQQNPTNVPHSNSVLTTKLSKVLLDSCTLCLQHGAMAVDVGTICTTVRAFRVQEVVKKCPMKSKIFQQEFNKMSKQNSIYKKEALEFYTKTAKTTLLGLYPRSFSTPCNRATRFLAGFSFERSTCHLAPWNPQLIRNKQLIIFFGFQDVRSAFCVFKSAEPT